MVDPHPSDPPENGAPPPPPSHPSQETLIPSSSSKRQRRPSVRLGEIGDQATTAATASPSVDPSSSSSRRKLSKLLLSSPILLPSKPSTKPRLTAPRRARTNWISPIENGFDDLECRDDEFAEDSESPDDRNERRGSARVRVSNEEGSEEGWAGGVRGFLEGLGLEKYAPIFEIHEVDEEVLPMLTLEDLRDMGINAVGSRRKMCCAIQKLGRRSD